MTLRRARLLTALAAAAILLTGCAAEPEPAPSAPVFATEQEAFAAAEETYRAYVDALNQVDLHDPATFEAVFAWTTGDANTGARKSFTQMHADEWVVRGLSAFDSFRPSTFSPEEPAMVVTADVCLDVSNVQVVDSSGASVVPPTRQDRQPALVTFALAPTATHLTIIASIATSSEVCD